MSIHDTMALWAFSEERTSVEFHSVAQKHANATSVSATMIALRLEDYEQG